MSVSNKQRNVSYGLSDALLAVPSLPIISERAPSTRDKAPLGTLWVDRPNNDGYILTSIVANSATWIGIGGGSGSFTDLVVSGTIDAGSVITGSGLVSTTQGIVALDGDIRAALGDIITDNLQGDIISGNDLSARGDITANNGNITATLGSVTAGTTVTAGTGITVTTGDIDVLTGDVTVDLGDIEAVSGALVGQGVLAAGDVGGTASTLCLTNVVDNTQGAGTLTISSASANPGTNTGFIKVYVGATVAYVPYFLTIAP